MIRVRIMWTPCVFVDCVFAYLSSMCICICVFVLHVYLSVDEVSASVCLVNQPPDILNLKIMYIIVYSGHPHHHHDNLCHHKLCHCHHRSYSMSPRCQFSKSSWFWIIWWVGGWSKSISKSIPTDASFLSKYIHFHLYPNMLECQIKQNKIRD